LNSEAFNHLAKSFKSEHLRGLTGKAARIKEKLATKK
jgi:hypothetical protein